MSFGQQPPPPKTTGAGTILGILALIFVGIPALLCLVGGIAFWGLAGFPGGTLGGKAAAWQKVVAEKQRLEQELIAELKTIAAANGNRIPVSELSRISMRGLEIDGKINELANRTHREFGEPSQAVKDQLKSTEELQKFVSTLNIPGNSNASPFPPPAPPGQSLSERLAQQRAESEQRMAALRAEQQQRDAQREAERQQREQQLAAQRLADQQAREQRLREFANNVPQPQPVNPQPAFNNPPAVPQQPQANDAPPGYPATDIAQLKLKDPVFVQVGGQWHPAFVQLKRGKLVQVRSTQNGAVEVVTLERIRLQNEPTAKPDSNVPPALQVAKAPKAGGSKQEEEDDALFIAKPPGEQVSPPAPTTAASPPSTAAEPAKPAATVAEYRTWTNDTGEFKVEAELVSFEFDLVSLRRRSDGKILSLRIEKFSAADQALIREKFK